MMWSGFQQLDSCPTFHTITKREGWVEPQLVCLIERDGRAMIDVHKQTVLTKMSECGASVLARKHKL